MVQNIVELMSNNIGFLIMPVSLDAVSGECRLATSQVCVGAVLVGGRINLFVQVYLFHHQTKRLL